MKGKLGQEEMVGFAVIMVIVAVIILISLGFLLRSPTNEVVESYEIESFIQSALQYTSDCESELEFLPVQKLIIACEIGNNCLDGKDSCEVMNSTLNELVQSGWQAGEESPIKGYSLQVIVNDEVKVEIKEGNETINYKSGFQGFARSGKNYEVDLSVYS